MSLPWIELRLERAKGGCKYRQAGIRFERACEVFLDPLAKVLDATDGSEARDALVGETNAAGLLFVHIEQEDEAIRIISARPASPAERKDYEGDA